MPLFFLLPALVLEEHVVFIRDIPQACKDGAFVEVRGVGTEAVDNVVVVPQVDHGDLGDGVTKETLAEPEGVALEVELLEFFGHGTGEGCVVLGYGVLCGEPGGEEGGHFGDGVVVDCWALVSVRLRMEERTLVSAAYHDMVRLP